MSLNPKAGNQRFKPRGDVRPIHQERVCNILERFGYAPSKSGFNQAMRHWMKRGGHAKSPHTTKKIFGDETRGAAEDTRREICEMFLALARGHEHRPEIAEVLAKLEPQYFILERDSDELHTRVVEHLKCLNKPYYGLPGRGWEVWETLPRVLQCLRDVEPHLVTGSSDQERLRVATLAGKWAEAAHYSGLFPHSTKREAHQIGVRAARIADLSRESDEALALLAHESPVDARGCETVSGTTWYKPLSRYGDDPIGMSLRKHDHGRTKYIEATSGQENNFTVSQIIVAARLKLCSNLESRTADACSDLSHAEALLGFGTDRTRAYFHMARHYYYSRRVAGESTRSVERRRQLEELRRTREHYSAFVRAEWHIWTAACDIRLAELSPSSVPRATLIQAVETILSTPFDRCCVADLSGVVNGSSAIYRRIPFDQVAFAARATRQYRVRPKQ